MNKHPDNAPEGIYHAKTVEACITAIEAQKLVFASDEYATPQPSGSIVGRFACDQSIAAIRALPTTPANATRLTSDDVGLIDGAEAAYDLARDAVVYPQRRAEYAIWAERYGRDLIALARRAAPAVDETAGDVAADVLARRAAAVNFAVACDPRG